MQYMGGKASIAKEITDILKAHRRPGQLYIEPFLGAANTFQYMENPRQGYDVHPDLAALWQAALDGWQPPTEVSEELYRQAKPANDNDMSPELRAFIGFGCSFGGKWFGGYARDHKRGRNYAQSASNGLLSKAANMPGAKVACLDYRQLEPTGALIYCDPPYANTTAYKGAPAFDSDEFWQVVRKWSEKNTVFVSEAQAPLDFHAIWERATFVPLGPRDDKKYRAEKLFTLLSGGEPANENR